MKPLTHLVIEEFENAKERGLTVSELASKLPNENSNSVGATLTNLLSTNTIQRTGDARPSLLNGGLMSRVYQINPKRPTGAHTQYKAKARKRSVVKAKGTSADLPPLETIDLAEAIRVITRHGLKVVG